MIQLKILSGKKAGAGWVARRFPVRIGRGGSADLQLEADGIWDEHLELQFQPGEGFVLQTHPNALTSVNGQPVERALLRNGDLIELGAAKLQFWLADTRQRGLKAREWLVWIGITLIALAQVTLIYWLLR